MSNDENVTVDRGAIERADATRWYVDRLTPRLVRRSRPTPPPPPTRPGSPAPAVIDESAAAFVGTPRNFLPVSQRRSWVTPAGVSESAHVEDPHPGRITAEMRRAQQNEVARAAQAVSQLSGSSTVRNPREEAQAGFTPTTTTDRFGRRTTSWQRLAADQEPEA